MELKILEQDRPVAGAGGAAIGCARRGSQPECEGDYGAGGDLMAPMRRDSTALARRNIKDMKCKRFLHKQLCEAEGIYSCCAPLCEVCTDCYVCF